MAWPSSSNNPLETVMTLKPFSLARWLLRAGVVAVSATAAIAMATPAEKPDILIGQSAPLSGMMAPTMLGVLAGQQMAFDEANRRGGINGRKVKLLLVDDGYDPKRSLENAKSLVEEKGVTALFGFVGTSQTASVLPYVAEKRVPLIAVYTGSPALRAQPNPYFFTTQASYADEVVRMVRNLKAVQATDIAIVYQNNDFGRLLLPVAEKVIRDEGAKVTISKPLENSGADAVAVAQSIAAQRPQAVLMIVSGPAVVAYVKANRANLGVPVYTFSLSVGSAILKALGDDARGLAVSRATPYPWRATTPLAREYALAMEKLDKPVDYDHYLGYINAKVLLAGLRAAGKQVTPVSLKEGMEKLDKLDLGGHTFSFTPQNHHGSNFVEITVVGPNGNFIR
jgi:branched-chain amino acid transport system substrate-binding protein